MDIDINLYEIIGLLTIRTSSYKQISKSILCGTYP